MRNTPNVRAERCRVTRGRSATDPSYGNNGVFVLRRPGRPNVVCIVSDGLSWDHVSCRVETNPERLPTWEEMCEVKELFFRDDEAAVQFHPAKAEYVNNHPWVLHLWRFQGGFPTPPPQLVGLPGVELSRDEMAAIWQALQAAAAEGRQVADAR